MKEIEEETDFKIRTLVKVYDTRFGALENRFSG
jgi:hypothetical protein